MVLLKAQVLWQDYINVLPAEPDIIHFKKPPVYATKLQVSNNQQKQAELFQELLAEEGKTSPIPEISLVSSQRALRWLIAFILMVAVGLMVIGGSQNVPLPSSAAIPDSTYAASRIISGIPDQAPVLMAFDYEPGTSGEMQAAAAALVDHLMLKGARLTLVSTLPTGPAVGEYFIQNVQAQHNYTSGKQYVNLGYIPGGAAGLASFVQMPKWIFKVSYDGMDPWETQPLQDIEAISDFAVVVIISDDPDVARTWVEQAQPKLGETPLLMVVSAQAEPLIRPYFSDNQNAQVDGIISGLSGGAAYEVTVGKPNLGTHLLGRFQHRVDNCGRGGFNRWRHKCDPATANPKQKKRSRGGKMNLSSATMPDLIGVLVGFTLTLFVFSYAWGDNPFFRIASHLFVGVAAGYATVIVIYNVILPQLIFPLLSGNRGEMILSCYLSCPQRFDPDENVIEIVQNWKPIDGDFSRNWRGCSGGWCCYRHCLASSISIYKYFRRSKLHQRRRHPGRNPGNLDLFPFWQKEKIGSKSNKWTGYPRDRMDWAGLYRHNFWCSICWRLFCSAYGINRTFFIHMDFPSRFTRIGCHWVKMI